MNFCKDCRFMRLDNIHNIRFAQCVHPEIAKYNPVSGELETFCETARKDFGEATSKCGPDGNLFEPFRLLEVLK